MPIEAPDSCLESTYVQRAVNGTGQFTQTIIAETFKPRAVGLSVSWRFKRMAEFTGEVAEAQSPRHPRPHA